MMRSILRIGAVAACAVTAGAAGQAMADEPIASLDLRNANIVMESLRRINKEDGITVIANLHLLETARDYCDRIIGMRKGAMVFDGLPGQLTTAVAKEIYGTELGDSEAIEEEERHVRVA